MPVPVKAAVKQPEYIGISLATLYTDSVIDCQLYLQIGTDKYVKYREPGFPFDEGVRRRLRENRHTHIFVRSDHSRSLSNYLEANLRHVLVGKKHTDQEKAGVLYSTTTHLIKVLLSDPRSRDEVRRAKRTVEHAVEYILRSPAALEHLIDISSIDYYTYTHSVNVMTYSVALGKRLGFKDGVELYELGQSALLHDVGKAFIDPGITNKDGPLTTEEFTIMKRHPIYGYMSLHSHGELSKKVLYAVRHHHEELTGHGYPHGLSSSQLELDVRIISCSDIYDALTTRRTYRSAYRIFPALRMMREWINVKVDDRVFREFVKMLGEI